MIAHHRFSNAHLTRTATAMTEEVCQKWLKGERWMLLKGLQLKISKIRVSLHWPWAQFPDRLPLCTFGKRQPKCLNSAAHLGCGAVQVPMFKSPLWPRPGQGDRSLRKAAPNKSSSSSFPSPFQDRPFDMISRHTFFPLPAFPRVQIFVLDNHFKWCSLVIIILPIGMHVKASKLCFQMQRVLRPSPKIYYVTGIFMPFKITTSGLITDTIFGIWYHNQWFCINVNEQLARFKVYMQSISLHNSKWLSKLKRCMFMTENCALVTETWYGEIIVPVQLPAHTHTFTHKHTHIHCDDWKDHPGEWSFHLSAHLFSAADEWFIQSSSSKKRWADKLYLYR